MPHTGYLGDPQQGGGGYPYRRNDPPVPLLTIFPQRQCHTLLQQLEWHSQSHCDRPVLPKYPARATEGIMTRPISTTIPATQNCLRFMLWLSARTRDQESECCSTLKTIDEFTSFRIPMTSPFFSTISLRWEYFDSVRVVEFVRVPRAAERYGS